MDNATSNNSSLPSATPAASSFEWEPLIRAIVIDREGGIPLHVQIRTSLRRILQTVPAHVEKLPAENTLMTLLGVSQATIRTALDGLVNEGLILRRRALGTLITRNRPNTLSPFTPASGQARIAPATTQAVSRIALIFPGNDNYSNSAHLTAITTQANARGTKVSLVAITRGDDWQSTRSRIDFSPAEGGVLFLGGFPPATIHDLHNILATQGYRTAAIGLPLEGCSCPAVGIDNRACVRTGLEHLRDAGHQRIAFLVGEPEQHPEVVERVRHFEELARELGLPRAEVIHGGCVFGDDPSEVSGRAVTALWKQRAPNKRPTALFGVSDACVVGALYSLAHLGVRIPDDVSLLGYDGTPLTQAVQPRLATLVTPMDTSAAALLSLLDEPRSTDDSTESPPRQILIAPQFRPGPSLSKC
ncbi:transcriptional regulator [Opitutaceae bacterium TAV5]|nr:transcriptional regulator [Opitutaceae bacterium TAV5]